jgi:hypothetical protein
MKDCGTDEEEKADCSEVLSFFRVFGVFCGFRLLEPRNTRKTRNKGECFLSGKRPDEPGGSFYGVARLARDAQGPGYTNELNYFLTTDCTDGHSAGFARKPNDAATRRRGDAAKEKTMSRAEQKQLMTGSNENLRTVQRK